MAINLSRNSKVFFTTNINSTTGAVNKSGFSPNNTFELQVLDGFSFTQNTNAEAVTVSESGSAPVRSQRSFNTSLAPVDFSFSTYIRPFNNTTGTTRITCEESVLWNALLGKEGLYAAPASTTLAGVSVAYAAGTGKITFAGTGLSIGTLTVGDTVVLSGITVSGGVGAASTTVFNNLATLDSGSTPTSVVFTLVNPTAVTTTTFTTPVTVVATKVSLPTAIHNAAQTIGGGGANGTVTGVTYNYNIVTKVGTISIVGTALPLLTANDVVGKVFTLQGITGAPTSSTSPTGAQEAVNRELNVAVTVAVAEDSTATLLKLTLLTPWTGNATVVYGALTLKLLNNAWAENTKNAFVSTGVSDQNQLQKFGMLFLIDNTLYTADNCALNQVSVDFGLDQIATAQWTGQGTALNHISNTVTTEASVGILGQTAAAYGVGYFNIPNLLTEFGGAFLSKNTKASYIANKLSITKLKAVNDIKDSTGTAKISADDEFSLAITGGNFTINNNITYLTPNILNTVNKAVTYFVGTRAVTGNVTSYLKTGGSNDCGVLIDGILDSTSNTIQPMFGFNIDIGGSSAPFIQITLPTVFLQVPTVDVQQIVSTTINFIAQGATVTSNTQTFEASKTNDAMIRYYAA